MNRYLVANIKVIEILEDHVILDIANVTDPKESSNIEILKFDDKIEIYFMPSKNVSK